MEFPKELFGDGGVPRAVCVREGVAPGGEDAADADELVAVDLFGIADFVEAEGAGELAEEEGVDLMGLGEDAGLDPVSCAEAVGKARRNELDELGEDGQATAQRFGCCVVFHTVRVPRTFPMQQPFFVPIPHPYGMAVNFM